MFIEHLMFDAFWRQPLKRTDLSSCSSGYHIYLPAVQNYAKIIQVEDNTYFSFCAKLRRLLALPGGLKAMLHQWRSRRQFSLSPLLNFCSDQHQCRNTRYKSLLLWAQSESTQRSPREQAEKTQRTLHCLAHPCPLTCYRYFQ